MLLPSFTLSRGHLAFFHLINQNTLQRWHNDIDCHYWQYISLGHWAHLRGRYSTGVLAAEGSWNSYYLV